MNTEGIISILENAGYQSEPITGKKPTIKHYQLIRGKHIVDNISLNCKRKWFMLILEKEEKGDVYLLSVLRHFANGKATLLGKAKMAIEMKSLIKDKILCGK